jgi:hypothetical protein
MMRRPGPDQLWAAYWPEPREALSTVASVGLARVAGGQVGAD